MKKLTAGIFAAILTVVTVNAANADIASKKYVDEKTANMVTNTDLDDYVKTTDADIKYQPAGEYQPAGDYATTSDLGDKQDKLDGDQLNAVNSGITSDLVKNIPTPDVNCKDCVLKYNGSDLVWESIARGENE